MCSLPPSILAAIETVQNRLIEDAKARGSNKHMNIEVTLRRVFVAAAMSVRVSNRLPCSPQTATNNNVEVHVLHPSIDGCRRCRVVALCMHACMQASKNHFLTAATPSATIVCVHALVYVYVYLCIHVLSVCVPIFLAQSRLCLSFGSCDVQPHNQRTRGVDRVIASCIPCCCIVQFPRLQFRVVRVCV